MLSGSALVFVPILAPLSSDPAHAGDEWLRLDQEIEALAQASTQAPATPQVHGWITTQFAWSGDVDTSTAPGNQHLGGFDLDNARLIISGEAAPGIGYTISAEGGDPAVSDAAGTGLALLDAVASVQLHEDLTLTTGRFSVTVLWTAGVEERYLLFLGRSYLDEVWDGRDIGFELYYHPGRFHAWAGVQNGFDGAGDELALNLRANYHLLGNAQYVYEGAQELEADEEHLTLGMGWFDDTSLDDGSALVGELGFAKGRWSAIGEVSDFGDDVQPTPVVNTATGFVIPSGPSAAGSQTAWGATLGYLLVPEAWEIAARFQDLDDAANTTVASASVNRYLAGSAAKVTLEYDIQSSDDPTLDVNTIALGLMAGF